MFRKNVVLELGSNYASEHHLSRNIFSKKIKNFMHSFEDMNSPDLDLRRKYKYSILLTDEEVNVSTFKFPKTNKSKLDQLVENELYYFTRRKGNLLFNYMVLKSDRKCIETLVIYFNSNKLDVLDKYLAGKIKLKGVFLVQLSVLSLLVSKIKAENYALIFYYKNRYYCLYCLGRRIFDCCTFLQSEFSKNTVSPIVNFIDKNKIYSDTDIQLIYTYNMEDSDIEKTVPKDYKYENLGLDRKDNIIRSTLRRRN